jgi:hypothetical protein
MSTPCNEPHHADHDHQHGPNCAHTAIKHGDHVDYLHDGHLHHMHGNNVDALDRDVASRSWGKSSLKLRNHVRGASEGGAWATRSRSDQTEQARLAHAVGTMDDADLNTANVERRAYACAVVLDDLKSRLTGNKLAEADNEQAIIRRNRAHRLWTKKTSWSAHPDNGPATSENRSHRWAAR